MASLWSWLPSMSEMLPTLIGAGTTLYGAQLEKEGRQEAARTINAATDKSTAAQLEALDQANQIIQQNRQAASPGLMRMTEIVGRGDQLTPTQVTALDEARRTTLDALQGGSLRGSARATADTVKKVEGDMRNQFIESNRNRADNAASSLSSQYFDAGNKSASIATGTGNAISQGLMTSGNVNAQADLGVNQLQGKALGDIGAIIAGQLKDSANAKRNSSYSKVEERV